MVDGRPYNDNNYWGVTAELNYHTEAGTLTIQPAYREADIEYAFNGVFRQGFTKEKDNQTSLEARWAGDLGDSIDYLLGGIYFDEDIAATARYNQQTLIPFQEFTTGTEKLGRVRQGDLASDRAAQPHAGGPLHVRREDLRRRLERLHPVLRQSGPAAGLLPDAAVRPAGLDRRGIPRLLHLARVPDHPGAAVRPAARGRWIADRAVRAVLADRRSTTA